MNSQEYIEVSVKIDPYSDENAEILMAEAEEKSVKKTEVVKADDIPSSIIPAI